MEARQLEHLDAFLVKGPQIGQAAAWGVLLGGVYGYFRGRGLRETDRTVKYAAAGALGFAAFAALSFKLGQGVSRAEHARLGPLGPPPPPSPVVTRGAFAGLPRPLFNTEDDEEE